MDTALPVGRTQRVDVGGRELNTWQAGDGGPVVLLVHGIPTNHRLWWDVVPTVAEHARVVAVDMLGYGMSDPADGWRVDLASQAVYLLRLLDRLDVERAVVVGHDLGGGVAQILTVTQPQRIAAMGVVNGACYDAWPVPVVRSAKAVWPLLAAVPHRLLPTLMRPPLRTLFADQSRAPAFLDRFVEPWGTAAGPSALTGHLRALDSVYTQAVAPFLPRLRLPVEVVWGLQDHQFHPRTGRRLAGNIPDAGWTGVDDASHFSPADRPDVVAAAVLRLLERL